MRRTLKLAVCWLTLSSGIVSPVDSVLYRHGGRDDWGSYAREVPKVKYLTGKIFTQRIERNNLTLRTRIKRLVSKTICFSRSVEIHEKVIGSFIEKHMFY